MRTKRPVNHLTSPWELSKHYDGGRTEDPRRDSIVLLTTGVILYSEFDINSARTLHDPCLTEICSLGDIGKTEHCDHRTSLHRTSFVRDVLACGIKSALDTSLDSRSVPDEATRTILHIMVLVKKHTLRKLQNLLHHDHDR